MNVKRGIVDVSSVIWTSLRVGKDTEQGYKVMFNDKEEHINSADYGYANAVNHMLSVMNDLGLQPHQLILVKEGLNSKAGRQAIYPEYKNDGGKAPEWYVEFGSARDRFLRVFLNLGAQVVWQDGVESDDVIGYLAKYLKGERWTISSDKDLAQVIDGDSHFLRRGDKDQNPFGPFNPKYIPVAIALLGDRVDGIPGVHGFGEKAFEKLLVAFGEEGLEAFEDLLQKRELRRLSEDVAEMKELQKVIDQAEKAYVSYHLARLRIDRVNTLQHPLQWKVGMVKPKSECEEPALRHFAGSQKLVSAENYDEAVAFFKKHLWSTPYFPLDIETSTPPESDEWLAAQNKEEGNVVDVFGSDLTGMSITFGPNLQYTFYLTHDHVEEDGVTNLTREQVRDLVDLIPRKKITWVHNAAFELPVLYNEWGEDWKDDPEYHGFLRNVRDTRIASSYVDENQPAGLKKLSKRLMDYEQQTYLETVTREMSEATWQAQGCPGRLLGHIDAEESGHGGAESFVRIELKMNQLPAREVVGYGCDDTICTAALANHFVAVMEIEDTYEIFEEVETWPAYVTALGFVQGVDFSLEEMAEMESEDEETYNESWATLRQYLIDVGFEGTVCPVIDELTPANIKLACHIVVGEELKSQVRTPSKLAKLIRQTWETEDDDDDRSRRAALLASFIEDENLKLLNELVQRHFAAEPVLDLGSPKQMKAFLYDTVGIPVQMVNDVTMNERIHAKDLVSAVYRLRNVRMGKDNTPLDEEELRLLRGKAKTDEKAINFAIAFDSEYINPEALKALKALQAMKKVMTRRSLFYKNYWGAKHWKDGKIHGQANQCAAVTRRYSFSNPNLQQLPKKGEAVRFRGCIKPHHRDAVIVSIDFSGQELRLAAERSQDKNMLSCYVGDKLMDIHSITAAGAMKLKWGAAMVKELYGRWGQDLAEGQDYDLFMRLRNADKSEPIKKQADDLRKDSKNVNFAAQFGGQALKISETIIMPVADAQLFLDARSAMFPDVDKAAKRSAAFAEQTGYALTLMGARRHLREAILSEHKWEVSAALRQAWNMEIQGSAGEMTKLGMARLWKSGALHRFDVRFIAPIHDELVTSVHRDHAVEFIRMKHEAMTQKYSTMEVPVMGSISLGPDFANQIECGDWFIEENIREAINGVFKLKEAA